jgi:hypothetical protein
MPWPRVGGIIAHKQSIPPSSPPPAPGPNVQAFDTTLTNLYGTPWVRDYQYVAPWDDAAIVAAVQYLLALPDTEVIVVTGTTLGEKVWAERDNIQNTPGGTKTWIVMATDDGDWTCDQFRTTWHAARVTGTGSGYSHVVKKRVDDLSDAFQAAHPGDTMQVAVLQADPALLGADAQAEKAAQLADVQAELSHLGLPAAAAPFYVGAPPAAGDPFPIGAPPVGANALFILGDATTFLARADIVAALGGTFDLMMGEWCAFVDAGGSMSYGPPMPTRYAASARYVSHILKGSSPGAPHCHWVDGDFEPCP